MAGEVISLAEDCSCPPRLSISREVSTHNGRAPRYSDTTRIHGRQRECPKRPSTRSMNTGNVNTAPVSTCPAGKTTWHDNAVRYGPGSRVLKSIAVNMVRQPWKRTGGGQLGAPIWGASSPNATDCHRLPPKINEPAPKT